ncbi:hypothetical protein KP003_20045 [Geomonas nitrogeniifigens]|uniref:hypothetical protein n=1 Tax=Geomonas diazotrophica TaxID=2843197 RepID=UPI001C2C37BA|nr:hypothetical protein [Geomonas nitrogeniifigens]QXE86612.1 hypothetical protein KP003_20045 [Geomonas nitrogeniifigens]
MTDAPVKGKGTPSKRFSFSTFTSLRRTKAKLLDLDKAGVISTFAKHAVRNEKDGKLFAPATFSGKRGNETFIAAQGICLDFDHGMPAVKDVLELFPGTFAVYHSTYSHTPEAPRFRIVLPLSRPVGREEHALLVEGVKSILSPDVMECLDQTCLERARAHFLPSCPPQGKCHTFASQQDGELLDVDHFIDLGRAIAPEGPVSLCNARAATTPAPSPAFEFVDPATGEVIDLRAWAVQNPSFDLIGALDPKYLRDKSKDGKQHIVCPFEEQHSEKAQDLATFAANASQPQYPAWAVHCRHAHCVERDRLEYLQAFLERGWLSTDHLYTPSASAALELRRPTFVNYPFQEITTELSRNPLQPDEFRIFLHLAHIAWIAHDGAILDDDWAIHRGLGITADQWATHRTALIRSGWLVESDGRLVSQPIKREYDKAQTALMGKIVGGQKGGLKTQKQRSRA